MAGNNSTHNIIASSVGTVLAELATIPICSVKTNYQTDLKYTSAKQVIQDIYKTRGLYGFYNSSLSAMSSQIVSTASKYTFYNIIKQYRGTESKDFINNVINGGFAGTMSSFLTHPFDVAKVHQQQGKPIIQTIKNEGSSVIYRGWSKTLSKNISLTGLLFPIYDFYSIYITNPWLSALCTSMTVTTFLHPIDYLKVRHISNQKLYDGFNLRYYYRGFHLNLMRATPHFMITMGVTEILKKYLKDSDDRIDRLVE